MGTSHRVSRVGSNGEAAQLDDDECDRIVDLVREHVPSDRPLIAGTGRESASDDRGNAARGGGRRRRGARPDAVILQVADDDGRFRAALHGCCRVFAVPVLLYNVTMFTGVNLQADAVERLAVHPNIVGMKESGSDIAQIAEFVSRTPDDFTVLAGSATTLVHALCAGCDGAILALAALVPDACNELLTLVRQSRLDEARTLQRRLLPIAKSVGGTYGDARGESCVTLTGLRGRTAAAFTQ